MTDSIQILGKRERLIVSAAELFHQRGVQRTTIGQIAEHADVPPGNVYYYFKTFDDLIDAVVSHHEAIVRENLERLDALSSPTARLRGLVELWSTSADLVGANGCPLGSLACELNKTHTARSEHASVLLRLCLDFVERQLEALGQPNASGLSVTIISRIQGAALLANTLNDPALVVDEVGRIERDLDSLT